MDDIHRPSSSRPQPMTTTPPPRTRVATAIPVSVKPATEPAQHPNVATVATAATAPTVPPAAPEFTEIEFEPPQIPARKEPEVQAQQEPVSEPEQESETKGQVTQAPTNQPRQKGHWGAIIVALILALALIAGAGYAYWQNQQTAKDVVKTPVKTTPEKPVSTPATADDVQATSDKIDQSIKETDAVTDTSEADLSDTTLGL